MPSDSNPWASELKARRRSSTAAAAAAAATTAAVTTAPATAANVKQGNKPSLLYIA